LQFFHYRKNSFKKLSKKVESFDFQFSKILRVIDGAWVNLWADYGTQLITVVKRFIVQAIAVLPLQKEISFENLSDKLTHLIFNLAKHCE
jgi:hypothetical protein